MRRRDGWVEALWKFACESDFLVARSYIDVPVAMAAEDAKGIDEEAT